MASSSSRYFPDPTAEPVLAMSVDILRDQDGEPVAVVLSFDGEPECVVTVDCRSHDESET
jgi:hypothetical protein